MAIVPAHPVRGEISDWSDIFAGGVKGVGGREVDSFEFFFWFFRDRIEREWMVRSF